MTFMFTEQTQRFFTMLLTISTISLISCGDDKSDSSLNNGKLKVVATTNIVGDAVQSIAGDRIELVSLMGSGVDPHLYKATKGDIDHLYTADIIFYSGLHLEAKMSDILKKMSSGKIVVPLAQAIPDSSIRYVDSNSHIPDPHIWFDVSLWSLAVGEITKTLSKADPDFRETYELRTKTLLDSMETLHKWVGEQLATIDKGHRILVTAHDAFGYFGKAYDVDVRGLQGISTVTEAGLYDITHMIDTMIAREIKAIFAESSVSRKSIDAVVEGCRSRGHDIIVGGQLYSDAMGTKGTPEGTYIGMVRYNVRAIVDALK